MSFGLGEQTRVPTRGRLSTNPSLSSFCKASDTGSRLMPSSAASLRRDRAAPNGRSPLRILSRITKYAELERLARSCGLATGAGAAGADWRFVNLFLRMAGRDRVVKWSGVGWSGVGNPTSRRSVKLKSHAPSSCKTSLPIVFRLAAVRPAHHGPEDLRFSGVGWTVRQTLCA